MRTIVETAYGKHTSLERNINEALKFLIVNSSRVEITDKDITMIKSIRSMVDSPIVTMFGHIVEDGLLDQFFIMDLSNVNADVPPVLSFDELSLDGSKTSHATPKLAKMWINLTPTLAKKKNANGVIVPTDVPRMMGYFVRGMFCMGYSDNAIWLSPSLASYVIETYSMAVRLKLNQAFKLDPAEAMFVQTAFAYHYGKLLSPPDETILVPSALGRCGFLGSYQEITTRIEQLSEAVGGDLYKAGIITVCEALAKAGPRRMEKIDAGIFFRMFSATNMDNMSMSLAIDYPPYWTYLLIRYASGHKNPLMGILFNLGPIKRKLDPFVREILTKKSLMIRR